MSVTSLFGPNAQTAQQRARVLALMQDALPELRITVKTPAYVTELYARYVAGELSWEEMRQAREAHLKA